MTPNEEKSARLDREDTTCQHWNGEEALVCRKGIRYQHVEKKNLLGTSSSLPCIGSLNTCKAVCESYSPPSREEMAHRRSLEMHVDQAKTTIMRESQGLRGIGGVILCPACGGQLSYVIAPYTGTLSGQCAKANCIKL